MATEPARPLRALAAASAVAGIAMEFGLTIGRVGGHVGDAVVAFLGYFTILTNTLAACALALPWLAPGSRAGRFLARPGVASAVATAVTFMALAYHVLLRGTWQPEGTALVSDALLHYVTPALYLGWWWIAVPKAGLRAADVPAWLGYPLAYVAYMLARGAALGSYPYFFLDARALGYGRTFVNALGLLLAFTAVALLLVGLGRLQGRGAASGALEPGE